MKFKLSSAHRRSNTSYHSRISGPNRDGIQVCLECKLLPSATHVRLLLLSTESIFRALLMLFQLSSFSKLQFHYLIRLTSKLFRQSVVQVKESSRTKLSLIDHKNQGWCTQARIEPLAVWCCFYGWFKEIWYWFPLSESYLFQLLYHSCSEFRKLVGIHLFRVDWMIASLGALNL